MTIDIVTIFPEIFDSYLKESILKRAQDKKLITINIHNLRGWTDDKHKTVDDKPFGGGLGMVMKVEPIYKAIQDIAQQGKKVKIVLLSPRGKTFTQKKASQYIKLEQLIMICGRYEGIDERAAKYIADEEISIGDYVLMGGEVAAMAITETVARLIPGVIGKDTFLLERQEKKRGLKGFVEYPEYTRPEIFETAEGKKLKVPKVLLSGNHKEIDVWKKKHGKLIR